MDTSTTSFKIHIDKAYKLHLKIVKDEVRYLNGKPHYMIVSAIEHQLWGFKPTLWTRDIQWENEYFTSISNAEKAIVNYFSSFDKKIEKGVAINNERSTNICT